MTVEAVGTVEWASAHAERHLSVLVDRWRHTQQVARRASEIAGALPAEDRDMLVAAAWLHDIGYSPALRRTGFHPLDGAKHLESLGVGPRLCALVAHHSGATYEAAQRGLSDQLAMFRREDGPLLDALVYADMTTGPQGQSFDFDRRIDEILSRYSSADPVHHAITAARSYLSECVQRTEDRLMSRPA